MRIADTAAWQSKTNWIVRLLVCVTLLCPPFAAQAQQLGRQLGQQLGLPQSPILTVEPDRLFAESEFGQRISGQLEAESAVLVAENRRIEAELTAEEKTLTERRAGMEASVFRALADAFDEKVQETRRTQDAKTQALSQQRDVNRQIFLQTARPILEALMREAEAGVILDRSTIFLSANATDITDLAIKRINAVLGDGSQTDNGGTP